MALTITAICNSPHKLFGASEELPWFGTGRELAQHDADFVKPALLYADRVRLVTGNYLFEKQVLGRLGQLAMPFKRLRQFAAVAADPEDRRRIVDLGVAQQDLPPLREAQEVWASVERAGSFDEGLRLLGAFEGDHETYFEVAPTVYGKALTRELLDAEPIELYRACESGLLSIENHTPLGDIPTERLIVGNTYLTVDEVERLEEAGARAVSELLLTASDTLLLDEWALGDGTELRNSISKADAAHRLALSTLVDLPNIRRASVDEILELRNELLVPLTRFRAAISQSIEHVPADPEQLDEMLRTVQVEQIQPALAELDELIQQDSQVRTFFRTTASGKDAGVVFGGLLIAAGVGGAATPLGLMATGGALTHQALELYRSVADHREKMRRSPFYFLHRVQRL